MVIVQETGNPLRQLLNDMRVKHDIISESKLNREALGQTCKANSTTLDEYTAKRYADYLAEDVTIFRKFITRESSPSIELYAKYYKDYQDELGEVYDFIDKYHTLRRSGLWNNKLFMTYTLLSCLNEDSMVDISKHSFKHLALSATKNMFSKHKFEYFEPDYGWHNIKFDASKCCLPAGKISELIGLSTRKIFVITVKDVINCQTWEE